ncbi:MAG: exo-alpha-sialidase [Acidobacteria bacterium]|nr:exo-alpha-sialidase [Acidobacteriota bacterium]
MKKVNASPKTGTSVIELLVSTRKGLLVFRGKPKTPFKLITRQFPGAVVEYAIRDFRSGRYFASVTHGQFGPHLFFTDQPDAEWKEAEGPMFPEDTGATLERTWIIEPATESNVLWAGTAPAALFRTEDGGQHWELNRALWNVPSRPRWEGGFGGLCLHSICTFPGDARRLAIGISAAGVWLTDDGGSSWKKGNRGLVARYLPEEARQDTDMLCIHKMLRAPLKPETLYMQFHDGVYRSDDCGESWLNIGGRDRNLPADFGFPLAVDPHNPDRAFVIPLTSDMDRVTPEGKLRVFETDNGGISWQERSEGLPQKNAFMNVMRQAFCTDQNTPPRLFFGTQSGELFGSFDSGANWKSLAQRLPPILSVRCSHEA